MMPPTPTPAPDEALQRMALAEGLAYLQAALGLVVAGLRALDGAWAHVPYPATIALASAALGYAIGRRHQAWAAAGLVAMVLAGPLVVAGRGASWQALAGLALLAWLHGRAFAAARAHAKSALPAT